MQKPSSVSLLYSFFALTLFFILYSYGFSATSRVSLKEEKAKFLVYQESGFVPPEGVFKRNCEIMRTRISCSRLKNPLKANDETLLKRTENRSTSIDKFQSYTEKLKKIMETGAKYSENMAFCDSGKVNYSYIDDDGRRLDVIHQPNCDQLNAITLFPADEFRVWADALCTSCWQQLK